MMPITSSAKKALARSRDLQERNDFFKVAMKRAIKSFRKALSTGAKKAEATELLQKACQAIDKAQRRNIVHKNTAARQKSRLSQALAKATSK